MIPRRPQRHVHCTDALEWLAAQGVIAGASFVTSLPDVSEVPPLTVTEWRDWFSDTAGRIVRACPDDGVCVFYQSDVIVDGQWQDKGHLVSRGAEAAGARLLFHRIACRDGAHAPHHGRPAFAHLLGFSRTRTLRRDLPRVDVLPSVGEMTWSRAIGLAACVEAVRFVRDHAGPGRAPTIVDPFCGRGTVLAVANALGLDAVGVERVRRRAQAARTLRVAIE